MNTQNRRIVVTGMGVVAPNGHGLDSFSQALRNGESGIRFIERLKELNFACHIGGIPTGIPLKAKEYFPETALASMSESMVYAGIAAIDAFKDAGFQVPAWDEQIIYEDTGAIIGTGIGGIDVFADKVYGSVVSGQVRRMGSSIVEQVMCSSVSARVGGILALGNQVTTNSAACSTGLEALIMGCDRIKLGRANRMLVGGAEGSSPFVWAGFDSLRVLCRKYNETPERASRPLSNSAAGFVPGAGGAVLVVEELACAQKRKAKIYAEILGTAITSGGMRFGGSMTAPSSRGVKRCIRNAMIESRIKPTDIDYINGHLTATIADPQEIRNWIDALEIKPEHLPAINATKSLIGHTLGAAGAIEAVATVLQLHQGFVHGSLNCEDVHSDLTSIKNSIVQTTRKVNLNIAAKASFGFGDVNSCVIFKKWEDS